MSGKLSRNLVGGVGHSVPKYAINETCSFSFLKSSKMGPSPSLSVIKSENAKISFQYTPVAVFVGGTSGVGRALAEAFARYTKGNTCIIIVGRNRVAAESIIASLPRAGPSVKHEFISCDVSLFKNVRQATSVILAKYAKINFLVLTTGVLEFARETTEDGIDRTMGLFYYSRWMFIHELIPALVRARTDNEDAKVLSVASAGLGGKINLANLWLKNTSYVSFLQSISTYNDLMVDGFAFHYPSITFIHCNPGWVRTPLGSGSSSLLFRIWSFLVNSPWSPLSYFPYSPEDCAENQLYGMLFTASKPSAWRIGQRGNDLGKQGYCGDEVARDVLWEHTLEVTGSK
ncbi:NAD-P-binding protein [Lentinula raphanica]|uniref:NAD-P-binding protein n=1 Tax=Lentinula raphanica TaxID=153919 RepID=A0AA38PH91_9AGAR|nr:NAD-P-binding protein [Lentinula raphanica]